MFISDNDPFRPTGYEKSYQFNLINQSSTIHSNNKSVQGGTFTFEPSFEDFNLNIAKCLYKSPYLENQASFNPFCPLCLKYVNKDQSFTMCNIKNSQQYILHDKCLIAHPEFQMNIVSDEEDEMFVSKISQLKDSKIKPSRFKSLALQSQQFLVEMIFYHPISQKKFGKIQKKQHLSRQASQLFIQFTNLEIEDQYIPNMLILPFTDFLVEIGIYEIGQANKYKIKKYLNFKKISSKDNKSVKFGNEQLQFIIQIEKNSQKKAQIVQRLNYKCNYPINKVNLMVIDKFIMKLPQELKERTQYQTFQKIQQTQTKMLKFLEIDNNYNDYQSHVTQKSTKSNVSYETKGSRKTNKFSRQNFDKFSQNSQHEKVNLERLIKTNTLKQFVKNNTQSRSFQHFLGKASNEQVDQVIQYMRSQFVEMMKHEYGNYMMQKLFSVCNLQKRIEILQVLVPKLNDIVMNKQGTHAFQEFLSFFTNECQYGIILEKIKQNFFQLCTHNNATHFVQKIVKIFPIELLNQFLYYCVQNLYQFGCDKNAMCVVKYIMKRLKQTIEKGCLNREKYQQSVKFVQQYIKLFVQSTVYNLDALIGDMYGNYVIQFNFEFFEPQFISTLTDSVLMKLPQYSLSKYSTNVVFKCLSVYWAEDKKYINSVLKQIFQPYLILEMYKNKDGNKILLEIMEKYQGYEIWNRLYNTLILAQPTRFYHDRWGVCLGSRSGNVGGNWSGFSDAVQKCSTKKKSYKYC